MQQNVQQGFTQNGVTQKGEQATQASNNDWDILIQNAKVFDGLGGPGQFIDIAIKEGVIAEKGADLPSDRAKRIINAQGKWLTPGLIDIHTHFDLEVEVEPGLAESVRHGTTSVVMSNCSLGVAFGKQEREGFPEEQPIVDCFARVENIPKPIIARCVDKISWTTTREYLEHFEHIALGPNVAPMVPHSMLRIEVMGLSESIKRHATQDELDKMVFLTQQAMDEGYVGFSVDLLPLHFLANDPHRNAKIPTQVAGFQEIKALAEVVRQNERTWQATPDPENLVNTFKMFFLTSARFYKKALKITATAAMDLHTNKRGAKMILGLSKLLNSKWLKGDIKFQALSAPFKVYADGVTTPLLEEKSAFRELNSLEIEDRAGRLALLKDKDFQARFRRDWNVGKTGINMARLKRKLAMEPTTFGRNLEEMWIDTCPIASWNGMRLDDLYVRVQAFQKQEIAAQNAQEEALFLEFPKPLNSEADFILQLLLAFDKDFRWFTYTANTNEAALKKILFHEQTIPGFNDSGAHLRNMAFYDGNLRTLKMAAQDSERLFALAVKKLTRDAAELFNINAGTLDIGTQADLVLLNPEAFEHYQPEQQTQMRFRDIFQLEQMVNRPPKVVDSVIIAGHIAVEHSEPSASLGHVKMGRALRDRYVEDADTFTVV